MSRQGSRRWLGQLLPGGFSSGRAWSAGSGEVSGAGSRICASPAVPSVWQDRRKVRRWEATRLFDGRTSQNWALRARSRREGTGCASFGGFGKGVGGILWKAANVLQNKLTQAQYLDEVTWTTKNLPGLQKQRISVVLHTAIAEQIANELACLWRGRAGARS